MSSITENYQKLKKEVGDDVLLVAVTKTHPVEMLNEVIDAGAAGACIMSGFMRCPDPLEYIMI